MCISKGGYCDRLSSNVRPYMKQNDDGKRCAVDILVPGVGEIIGGSQREDDYQKLMQRVEELKMNKESLWWYFDLRRFGSVHGFG